MIMQEIKCEKVVPRPENYEGLETLIKNAETIESLERIKDFLLRRIEQLGIHSSRLEELIGKIELKEIRIIQRENGEEPIENHILSAKTHCYAALTLDPKRTAVHYDLFQTAVLEEDYEDALDHLRKYDTEEYNFSLVYALLEKLLGRKILIPSKDNASLQDANISYLPILQNYRLAGESLEKGTYDRVARHLEVCDTLAQKKHLPVDFSSSLLLAQRVFEKSKESRKQELRRSYAENFHVGNRMLISQKLLSLDATDVESHFLFMDSYLDLKVYTPLIEECELLRNLPKTKEQEEMLARYQRLVREKQLEYDFVKELEFLLGAGKQLEDSSQFAEAFAHYKYGYQKTGIPSFYLHMATTCEKMGDHENAIRYAKEYCEKGYFYFVQTCTLMYNIYRQMGNMESAMQVAMECYKKSRMKERGFSLSEWMNQLETQFSAKDEKSPKEDSLRATYQYRITQS